jgi:hypothetical protein
MESYEDIRATVRELKDRQEILDCIYRYSRGIDRADRDVVLSAYHPDAIDDHGVFVGLAADFVDWALSYHGEHQIAHQHAILNHICELSGDTAHTETYYLYQGLNKAGPIQLGTGRYIDRFERRNGRWGIAARVCLSEWSGTLGAEPMPPEFRAILSGNGARSRNKDDVSYMRPLRVTRPLGNRLTR